MRVIRENLSRRGLINLPSLKAGTNWLKSPQDMALIDRADLVIINGEGTLHHGKRKGLFLLEAAARCKRRGARVALINTIWQDNPRQWGDLVSGIDTVWCRDSNSAEQLRDIVRCPVNWIGDLSLCADGLFESNFDRSGVIVSCSVHSTVTKKLAQLSGVMGEGCSFVPITSSIKGIDPNLNGIRRFLRTRYANFYEKRFMASYPRAYLVKDDVEYLDVISKSALQVTGRYHAVCLSLVSMTPFIAVASNSWKIEALIQDVGLDPERIQPLSEINPMLIKRRDWSFSEEEKKNINNKLGKWRNEAQIMFDDLAAQQKWLSKTQQVE